MKEIDALLTWTAPKPVNTSRGPRLVSEAKLPYGEPASLQFWALWKLAKEQIKAAGYSVSKKDDEFIVTRWQAPSQEVVKAQEASRAASRATDADVTIPAPDGLSYLPYQRAGIAFAQAREASLIADEMGLGKTIQAIGVINATQPTPHNVLIVCPASLRINWQRELEKWLVPKRRVAVIESGKDQWPMHQADVLVLNYDLLTKFHDEVRSVTWDLLVADECHYLKNDKAQRTIEVIGRPQRKDKETGEVIPAIPPIPSRRRVLLTGTPIVNRPKELWPIISYLAPQTWDPARGFFLFAKRYCDAKQVQVTKKKLAWDFSGASNLAELQDRLRGTVMVRRLKAEVMKELPPKRRQAITLPANGCASLIAAERATQARAEEALRKARVAMELAKASDDEAEYKRAVAQLRAAQGIAFTEVAKARHDTAVAKVPYVLEHLERSSGKVIVFAHHHDVIDALKEALKDEAVVLDGRQSSTARQAAVDRFQNDPTCRFFLGGIRAAGVGITLTASSHVVFAELDFAPAVVSQAEDRAHRIGQVNSVLVQHIVLDGSIDARMVQLIMQKQEVITAALDDRERAAARDAAQAIEAAKTEEDRIAEAADNFESFLAEAAEAATREVTRKQLADAAIAMSPQQVAAVHHGLRFLDGLNGDMARQRNAAGFNRIDTGIGASLAASARLSPKQAALGAKILRKYKRQLPSNIYTAAMGEQA